MGANHTTLMKAGSFCGPQSASTSVEETSHRARGCHPGEADMWPRPRLQSPVHRGFEDKSRGSHYLDEIPVDPVGSAPLPMRLITSQLRFVGLRLERDQPNLTTIVECHQPLLQEIAEYVSSSPREFARFCGLSAKVVAVESQFASHPLWEQMYARKWPAFYECLDFLETSNWQQAYKDTQCGRVECLLEVFDREKKMGFAMSAMAARVTWEASSGCYIAHYLSASEVLPEKIAAKDERRLRFCPPSVREALKPGQRRKSAMRSSNASPGLLNARLLRGSLVADPPGSPQGTTPAFASEQATYPYKVLTGFHGLRIGQGVELQWKMQAGSPFGWWYGVLENLRMEQDDVATATITFRHFPVESRWYQLEVTFGDNNTRPSSIGGFSGGLRGVSDDERLRWMEFFPKRPVLF